MQVETLIACGVSPTQARAFAVPLREAFHEFAIGSPKRQAAFLAQAIHESGGFARLEENLFYTTPERIRQNWPARVVSLADAASLTRRPQALANRVYAGRLGNGDESSGDGWIYRGRGLFQLTGRENYERAGLDLGQPYVSRPELVASPFHAALTAAWFWSEAGCNAPADMGDIAAITRKINGPAMLGQRERADLYTHALEALNVERVA